MIAKFASIISFIFIIVIFRIYTRGVIVRNYTCVRKCYINKNILTHICIYYYKYYH